MQIEGLLGTRAVNDWESEFIQNILEKTNGSRNTEKLTAQQIERINQIYNKHFV